MTHFTKEELQALLEISNRIQLSGKEARALVAIQMKIEGYLTEPTPEVAVKEDKKAA